MRNLALLGTRVVVGGYLSVHAAQKLFGAFGGPGLDDAGTHFEKLGLEPGRQMAALAGATELGGALLTATGFAEPLGPLAIAGAMSVAAATHRSRGPLAAKGGFELPLAYLAAAAALAAGGSGRWRIGPRLPRPLALAAAMGTVGVAAALVAKVVKAESARHPESAGAGEADGAERSVA